jgi:hypothetical protein
MHPTWGRHHWHSESDCCVCQDNPCSGVDVRFALDHERREARQMAEATTRAIDYAITHGHREPDPFDVTEECPSMCRKGSGTPSPQGTPAGHGDTEGDTKSNGPAGKGSS